MLEKILFVIFAFILFVYVFIFKLIKRNDTNYISLLCLQAIGIFINFIQVFFEILKINWINILVYVVSIILPLIVFVLEKCKINVSEKADIIISKGLLLIGNRKKAKKRLIILNKKYKHNYLGHKILGEIYEKEGGLRKAIDEYVKALEFKKNDYDIYYKIAVLLNEQGKKDESLEMLTNLLNVNPQNIDATGLLGELLIEKQEYKKAIEGYLKYLKHDENNALICYNLGLVYAKTNDFWSAKECFKKVIELESNNYNAIYKLGQISLLYCDFDKAEEYFKRSAVNEKKSKSYYQLAKVYIMKADKENAIKYLNMAIDLNYDYYKKIREEPVLSTIIKSVKKPRVINKENFIQTEKENIIEEYLSNTYELTQILQQNEKNN